MLNRLSPGHLGMIGVRSPLGSKGPSKGLRQGPWVEVRPQIDVSSPINIELGGLPVSLGLFLGSGLAFLLRPQLKNPWQKTASLVVGAGLGVAGILNLIRSKTAGAATPGQPGLPGPSAPPGVITGSSGYSASDSLVFNNVSGKITSPSEGEEVNLSPIAGSISVRIQLFNSSASSGSLGLELAVSESPNGGDAVDKTLPLSVSLAPGEVKEVDVNVPLSTWGFLTDYAEIYLELRKRRSPSEGAEIIASRSFVIE